MCILENYFLVYIFFFQAEDGIRDYKVTGVQTCALPISDYLGDLPARRPASEPIRGDPNQSEPPANYIEFSAEMFWTHMAPRSTFDSQPAGLGYASHLYPCSSWAHAVAKFADKVRPGKSSRHASQSI